MHRIAEGIYGGHYIDRYGVHHSFRLYGNGEAEWYWEVETKTGTMTAPSSFPSRGAVQSAAEKWLEDHASLQPVETDSG